LPKINARGLASEVKEFGKLKFEYFQILEQLEIVNVPNENANIHQFLFLELETFYFVGKEMAL
jgi:hypothetical protein